MHWTWALVLHLFAFRNNFNVVHLHLRLERSHYGVGVIKEFADVDVAEVAWWAVGAWAWRLEPLRPPGSAADTERWRFCAMEVS